MKRLTRPLKLLCAAAAGCVLAACGGGEVGGTVSGLGSERSVTLLNNGSDALTVSRDGSFVFADRLDANAAYAVTVRTQPVGQSCSVAGGTGALDADGASIDSVRVRCTFLSSVRGTVSGLLPGVAVVLIDGAQQSLLTINGPFAFAQVLAEGSAYEVRVKTQPANATCSVRNGTGRFFADRFTDVLVDCN